MPLPSALDKLVPDYVAAIKPYVPGKPIEELERELGIQGSIKLASNENPLGPSPKAIEAIRRHAPHVHIYPDASAFELKRACSRHVGAGEEEITVGNGSNELLTIAARTFCRPGDHAVISDYSFIAYRIIMQAEGLKWTSVPMRGDHQTDVDALIAAVTPKTRLLFLANPNNPTGTYVARDDLRRLLERVPERVVVVVDEAYHEYVRAPDYASAMTMREIRERLMITRTFSKAFGLGGMRVGFSVAPAQLTDYINRVREPFNCNLLGQLAASAALEDEDFIARSVEVNERGRAALELGLKAMSERGVRVTPSQTNFLLVHAPVEGQELYERMLRRGVIVRPMAGYGLARSLRVTIGTEAQCARFLEAFEASLSELERSERPR